MDCKLATEGIVIQQKSWVRQRRHMTWTMKWGTETMLMYSTNLAVIVICEDSVLQGQF